MRSKPILILAASTLLSCPADLAAQAAAGPGPAAERGIWIGDLDLCRAGPVEAKADTEIYSGLPIVSIVLPAPLRQALAELTAANIGKPLAIRVDGRVVSEPHVNEPITGGQLQISGVDQAEAERIAAALQSCPADTDRA